MPAQLVVSYLESVSSHFYPSVSAPESREAAPGGVGDPRGARAAAPAPANDLSFLSPMFSALSSQLANNAQRAPQHRAAAPAATVVHVHNHNNINNSSSSSSQAHSSDPAAARKSKNAKKAEEQQSIREKDDRRNMVAAIVGGIGVVYLGGLQALSNRTHSNHQELMAQSVSMQVKLLSIPTDAEPGVDLLHYKGASSTILSSKKFPPIKTKNLIALTGRVITALEPKCARSRQVQRITGAALATAAAGFIGGMLSLKWLVTASIIAGVAVLAFAAYTTVENWTAKSVVPADLKRDLDNLLPYFRGLAAKDAEKVAVAEAREVEHEEALDAISQEEESGEEGMPGAPSAPVEGSSTQEGYVPPPALNPAARDQ